MSGISWDQYPSQYDIWIESRYCEGGFEGQVLHAAAGKEISLLQPKLSSEPTVTLEGSQGNQTAILHNFEVEVCKAYVDNYKDAVSQSGLC